VPSFLERENIPLDKDGQIQGWNLSVEITDKGKKKKVYIK
jgi:hypothetical protein